MSCEHLFLKSEVEAYDVCPRCDTFMSREPLAPHDAYGDAYWSGKHSHGSIYDQQHNVDVHREGGLTKNEYVMSLMRPGNRDAVMEIACAPGNLLGRLKREMAFSRVIGLEYDALYEPDIRKIADAQVELVFGCFPWSANAFEASSFDVVIGLDIFEHAFQPRLFLEQCKRLLKTGGQLILMCPMVVPGQAVAERFFHRKEHVYIHSQSNIRSMLEELGFSVEFGAWTIGHETVSAMKTDR